MGNSLIICEIVVFRLRCTLCNNVELPLGEIIELAHLEESTFYLFIS